MPITVQTAVFDDLKNLSNKVKGPEVVQELARTASEAMIDAAPVGQYGDAGLLSRTLSEVAGPEPREGGWWAGVGNLEGIYPLKSAPRDTIKNFLELIGKGKKGKKETPSQPPKAPEGDIVTAKFEIPGFPYPPKAAKVRAWKERGRSMMNTITQTGATATSSYTYIRVSGTMKQIEAAKKALSRRRIKWEED